MSDPLNKLDNFICIAQLTATGTQAETLAEARKILQDVLSANLLLVPATVMQSIYGADVNSGVCCCGASMDGHGYDSTHGARDQWDYMLEGYKSK